MKVRVKGQILADWCWIEGLWPIKYGGLRAELERRFGYAERNVFGRYSIETGPIFQEVYVEYVEIR